MDEKDQELEFTLEDIMKEFSDEPEGEDAAPKTAQEILQEAMGEAEEEAIREPEESAEGSESEVMTSDTIRIPVIQGSQMAMDMGDTIRVKGVREALAAQADQEAQEAQETWEAPEEALWKKAVAEPFSESWEPEYEQPMGDYVPPQPIVFHPRPRLRELKKKLVNGPERRYYELGEVGFGKLQVAIFFSLLLVLLSAGATALFALDMVPAERMKLMVFGQFLTMLLSAVLGCYQLIEGVSNLFRKKFSLNTMLVFTFIACCVDGVFCLQEQRVPCCAAFSLQVTMSLWSEYHKRSTEMGMMDTMRKANHLDSIVKVSDYYDGCAGLLRGEGQVEDFMDHYNTLSRQEKVLGVYALAAAGVSAVIGVAAGLLHSSVSFGVQVLSVALLAAVPGSAFVTLSRPMAVLEKRLHKLGAVLCGWKGVESLSGTVAFPLSHEDLFPTGCCKLNGVKFYGTRDTDEVVAYCTALVVADGGGLAPLFEQLLASRNGRHYTAENVRAYAGGIGGEVCGESVLMGSVAFLQEMGVETPEGTGVTQAVYCAVDGEFCGVFAVTYAKAKSSAAGVRTLCGYRGLRPVLTAGDFMLTEEFIRDRFNVNTRRMAFPQRDVRMQLKQTQLPEDGTVVALITSEGLAPFAYAVTGARSLRTAAGIGTAIHITGGILGLAMMLVLAVLGEAALLNPVNMFLFELVWLIPGLLITEWTRSI